MSRTLAFALGLSLSLAACTPDSSMSTDEAGASARSSATSASGAEDDDEGPENGAAPPAAVAAAFRVEHPGATGLEWSQEEGGQEASFTEDGTDVSVVYAADGTAGAVETEIDGSALPAPVTAAIARAYAEYRLTEAARIEDGGATTYEAELTRDGRSQDVIFNADGTVVPAAGE